ARESRPARYRAATGAPPTPTGAEAPRRAAGGPCDAPPPAAVSAGATPDPAPRRPPRPRRRLGDGPRSHAPDRPPTDTTRLRRRLARQASLGAALGPDEELATRGAVDEDAVGPV